MHSSRMCTASLLTVSGGVGSGGGLPSGGGGICLLRGVCMWRESACGGGLPVPWLCGKAEPP